MTAKEEPGRFNCPFDKGCGCTLPYDRESGRSGSVLYSGVKRLFDLLLSFLAIVVLFPFLFLLSVLVRVTSPGPAIYRQKRVGRDGRLFWTYKFRTMVDGAEQLEKHLPPDLLAVYQQKRKLPHDPRVTGFGRFLRQTSLDELPQIFNIFRGDMSIVGPRPMLPEEIGMYGPGFGEYIKVRPGLTGLWQIRSRCRTTMSNRARLDACYLKHVSIRLDCWILLRTIRVVLTKKGAC